MTTPAAMKTALPAPIGVSRQTGRTGPWLAGLCAGLLLVAGTWALAVDEAAHVEQAHAVSVFQLRVTGPADTASEAVLARRYLETLPPALRQQISEQVREEQRAGTTEPGTPAFVLRRLALYEAAWRALQAD